MVLTLVFLPTSPSSHSSIPHNPSSLDFVIISFNCLFPFTGPASFLRDYMGFSLEITLLWSYCEQEAAQNPTLFLALSHSLLWSAWTPYAEADMAQCPAL